MKIKLTEEILYMGALYGPGEIDVADEKVAKALEAREEQLRASGAFDGAHGPLHVNGIMTGIRPNTQTTGPKAVSGSPLPPSNGVTPQDIEKSRQDAESAAIEADKRQREQAAAANASGDLPLTGKSAAAARERASGGGSK